MSEQNNQEELKAILKKYLNNDAGTEEREAINSWYRSAGAEHDDAGVFADEASKAELSAEIKHYLKLQIMGRRKSWLRPSHLKYAAACLLVISVGIGSYSYFSHLNQDNRKEIVISSGNEALKQLSLPDGSEVLLNVSSKLIISKDFGHDSRKVTLTGEAFFKVAKDKTKPFIIQSGRLKTRVVGTSFNISAYPDLERIKVAVLTGKVKVSASVNGHEQLLAGGMTKGTTLSFYTATQKTDLKTEDTELISSWRENKLYIDNATIEDIARQLERYYHIKVVCNGPNDLKDRYTIRFNKESMNGVLQILAMLTKRKFVYQNHQIIIK